MVKSSMKLFYHNMTVATSVAIVVDKLLSASRQMYLEGFVGGSSGNISGRINRDHILIKRSGRRLGFLKPRDLILVPLSAENPEGASSDYWIHREIYRLYGWCNYVIHAHPKQLVRLTLDTCLEEIPIETYEGRVYIGDYVKIFRGRRTDIPKNLNIVRDGEWGYIVEAGHGAYLFGRDLEWLLNMLHELEYIASTHYSHTRL